MFMQTLHAQGAGIEWHIRLVPDGAHDAGKKANEKAAAYIKRIFTRPGGRKRCSMGQKKRRSIDGVHRDNASFAQNGTSYKAARERCGSFVPVTCFTLPMVSEPQLQISLFVCLQPTATNNCPTLFTPDPLAPCSFFGGGLTCPLTQTACSLPTDRVGA